MLLQAQANPSHVPHDGGLSMAEWMLMLACFTSASIFLSHVVCVCPHDMVVKVSTHSVDPL